MQINLSPEIENYVKDAVKSGLFKDESELINEAVRHMQMENEEMSDELLAALQKGEDAIERGEYEVLTPELFDKIIKQGIADAEAGKEIDPDVLPEPGIVVTELAGCDLSGIANYTSLRWGERQLDVYRALLWEALMTIRRNPQIGRETGTAPKKYRVYPAGEHVTFYRVKDETVYVHRILHKRMDKGRHL